MTEAQSPASRNSTFDDALNARLSELGWKREMFTAADINNMQWAWNAATASRSEQQQLETPIPFGNDCPHGMVQVEFVGVDPELRCGKYGWKPSPSAFVELWVDGKRFRIDAGDMTQYGHEGKRGIHVNYHYPAEVENRSVNALTITLPAESGERKG